MCDESHDIRLNILFDLLGSFKWNLSFARQLRKALDTILDSLLDLTAACDDRREVTNDEGVKGNANQHPNERENYLSVREGWYVTISNGCNRLGGPVQRPYVMVNRLAVANTDPRYPSIIRKAIELRGQEPKAGKDMSEQHCCDHTLNHTLNG